MQPKALYRRAVAQRLLGQLEGAREDLTLATQTPGAGGEIRSELALVRGLQKAERERERGLYRRMFQQGGGSQCV